ncbi:MAG: UDP-N-acetylmuramoyl-L-alanyl-D-glutamate--2,6-diaminopimelate ligase [Mycobacteriales bacterium]|nr:UDP-N-acetylmuramoyl-L-alanyl-D-glutamate--2,6-diaminopimelate ligase [Frankia sp.]
MTRAAGPRPSTLSGQTLTTLAAAVAGRVVGAGDLVVTGIAHDSRAVRPGDVYAALRGAHADGNEFIDDAVAAGAVAVLTDRDAPDDVLPHGVAAAVVVDDVRAVLGRAASVVYGEPSRALDVVGVTGTNGKTTTAYLLHAGLRAAGRSAALIGTIETRINDERFESAHTTPEAPDLQALLAVIRERGLDSVAMEVSSHGLALGRVAGTTFAVAVFTNLTQDHLDFHDDMESYFAAKATLFEPAFTRRAVVNVDDAWGRRLRDGSRVPTTTFSVTRDADWRAVDVRTTRDGTAFVAEGPQGSWPVQLQLLGAFNVSNALGALAALACLDVDIGRAAAGLGELLGVEGRLERVDAGQPWLAVVDYAHTPDAVAAMLGTLRALTPGRLIVVLGCGGDRDPGKRPLMGAAAMRGADVAVLTSDNPRSEDPGVILAAMLAGARATTGGEVVVQIDRARAIRQAAVIAGPDDTVVVAGKGHEQGQVFADRVVDFDDRVVLRAVIAALHPAEAAR